MKVLIVFQTLQVFERTFTVPGKKNFGSDIKIEKCSRPLRNHSKNKTSESSLFFNFFRTLNEHLPCLVEKFSVRQGSQNWKLQSSSDKIKRKIKLWKNLFFFQNFQNFERTFTVLGEKFLGRGIKSQNCTLCL